MLFLKILITKKINDFMFIIRKKKSSNKKNFIRRFNEKIDFYIKFI